MQPLQSNAKELNDKDPRYFIERYVRHNYYVFESLKHRGKTCKLISAKG